MGLLDALRGFSKRRSRRNLYPWLQEAIDAHRVREASRVLNVGAGGDVAEALARAGVRATAIDIDPARGPDLVADLETLVQIADASIDAVICLEVLEHVRRPEAAAAAIRRVLRPGGLLIGSTPFLLGIHDAPHDYYRYTSFGLRHLFGAFEAVELRERNGYFAAIAVLIARRFAVGTVTERRRAALLSPLLLALLYALEALDRILPSAEGSTGYFFVFRKPARA
jgi:2-polyprenyl-3-methyl-5-hydroxy-6-metoxy-1,4-benzoquinol methylase